MSINSEIEKFIEKIALSIYNDLVSMQTKIDFPELSQRNIHLKPEVIAHFINKHTSLARNENSSTIHDLFIFVKPLNRMELAEPYITKILTIILSYSISCPVLGERRNISGISDMKSKLNVIQHLAQDSLSVRVINPVDESRYIPLKNGIYDMKSKRLMSLLNVDILSQRAFNYMTDEEFNDPKYQEELKIIEHMYSDMSKYGDDALFVKQHHRSAIENNNRNKWVRLMGKGHNGKSLWFHIMVKLVGESNVARLALEDFDKDTHLNLIKPNTRLIMQEETDKNSRLKGRAWRNAKTLLTGGEVSINQKFKDNRNVSFTCACGDASNSETVTEENNFATERRLIFYELPEPDDEKFARWKQVNIEKRLKSQHFVDLIGNYLLRNVADFDTYTEPEEAKKLKLSIMNDSDIVSRYIDQRGYLFLDIKYLLIDALYDDFKQYCISQGVPTNRIKQQRMFTTDIQKHLKEYGYEYHLTKIRYSAKRMSLDTMYHVLYDSLESTHESGRSRYFEKSSDYITQKDVDKFAKTFNFNVDIDRISSQDAILLRHLASIGHTEAIQLVDKL